MFSSGLSQSFHTLAGQWDRFWFRPAGTHSLALMRICVGLIVIYNHWVWGQTFDDLLAPDGFLGVNYAKWTHESSFVWSHFFWIRSAAALKLIHVGAFVWIIMFTLGLITRVSGILTLLTIISYSHRATGVLMGVDQTTSMIVFYLCMAPSGNSFAADRWIWPDMGTKKVSANVILRLIQIHLCVIYLSSGLGKLQGELWWNGEAMWNVIANGEFQTFDLLWLAHYPRLLEAITHLVVFWEISYPVMIWLGFARPIYLVGAVLLHAGTGLALGLTPFALAMLVANMAFLPSHWRSGSQGS